MKFNLTDLTDHNHRRLVLEILDAAPNGMANTHEIQSLMAGVGSDISHDRLSSHVHWLTEQRLLSLEEVGAGHLSFTVCQLTRRGTDVARGRARHPGVAPCRRGAF
uniref:ArsR family transcriptional regulator n=1 Tax=Candidatus Kentrum sp. UNK TaxID=2126344 RepID=A0A450ZWU2_9GAMM|nr:MAG: hypothetical protein BECKUNK1418G_GA0071005_100252 [Candidatus Kentron sp. UNK]VFK68323.1 MAG: hypothetical protein BECKUNK1418H_GA0071006_100152 [Candidatus Kentron sp. UNK]